MARQSKCNCISADIHFKESIPEAAFVYTAFLKKNRLKKNTKFLKRTNAGREEEKAYCDKIYKGPVGLMAGSVLYDVITAAEKVSDATHAEPTKQLKSMVESIEMASAVFPVEFLPVPFPCTRNK